jgi:hypothetical protein
MTTSASTTHPDAAAGGAGGPLHPGAERYLRAKQRV